MSVWVVYHHSGEIIGIYDEETIADDICLRLAGDGGAVEHRVINKTITA